MSDNDSVFSNTDVTQPLNTTPAADSPVSVLVGEGRKYATVEELAKAYISADGFIETLKTENDQLRTKVESAKTIDDVLERIGKRESKPEDTPAPINAPDVAKLVKETLTGMETAKTRESNLRRADAQMKALFGDKAAEKFSSQATTPELKAALTNLASVDPDKFIAIFHKGETTPSVHNASSPSFSSAALQSQPVQDVKDKGTNAYWTALRKANPKIYYSADAQLEMHKQAQANPDRFFGRTR